jgi:hypothetical protein
MVFQPFGVMKMIIDKYTKSVLTVIALSLLVIAFKDTAIVSPAYAEFDRSEWNVINDGFHGVSRGQDALWTEMHVIKNQIMDVIDGACN